MLTIKAYSANFESKLLIAVAEIWGGDVQDGQNLCRGGVNL